MKPSKYLARVYEIKYLLNYEKSASRPCILIFSFVNDVYTFRSFYFYVKLVKEYTSWSITA
jgi:hypothetical protein